MIHMVSCNGAREVPGLAWPDLGVVGRIVYLAVFVIRVFQFRQAQSKALTIISAVPFNFGENCSPCFSLR